MQVKPLSNSSERRFLDSLESVAYENLASPDFNASELARKLHVGRTTLAKKMKELVGMSPADYISACRFRKCLELLKESDLSIGEISYKCGFRNQSYFNLKFKERFGRSPRQVREEKPEETAKQ